MSIVIFTIGVLVLLRMARRPRVSPEQEPRPRRRWTRVEDACGQYLHRYLDENGDVMWHEGDHVP